ncbi:MAG: response regulator transcription factor [Clostridia bacterium]
MIPSHILPAFDGSLPCTLITSSAEAIPNITNISRVWYIDENHVAIANQFLLKAEHNLRENGLAVLKLVNPEDFLHWELTVHYIRSETEGPLFDAMLNDLHTVSWMAGFTSPVHLRAALIFEVVSVRKCLEESLHLATEPELYADMLQALAAEFDWSRLSYWGLKEDGTSPQLLASRGVPGAGTNPAALEPMRRLAALVIAENRIIRLRNIRSQLRYVRNISTGEENPMTEENPVDPKPTLPTSFLAFPILAFDSMIGIVCYEETDGVAESAMRLEDDFLSLLSKKLGETVAAVSSTAHKDREPLFKQVIERVRLDWSKAKEPFHTILSARERQVSLHVAKGLTNAEIAKALFVSTRTVTTHLERIFLKLQVTTRAALTRYIIENNLGTFPEDEV